jgi:MFS family permease
MTQSIASPSSAGASAKEPGGMPYRVLALVGVVCIAIAFFLPAWWVSLKAPNYPEHTFPDGVRIHFHVDGVRNGCTLRASKEILEKEALDCVHEMDTINHFVGMFPIASGGPVEKVFAPFLFSFLALLAFGFAVPGRRTRLAVMGVGFAIIAAWMSYAMFMPGGAALLSKGYISAMVESLGRGENETGADAVENPIIKQLRESLARSGIQVGDEPIAKPSEGATKAELLDILRKTFEKGQPVSLTEAAPAWTGSGLQLFAWHYDKSLGRWFNEPERNGRLVRIMTSVAYMLYAAVLIAMAAFLWFARDARSPWFWTLVLVPMILPIAFVIEYSGWLWWYGHSLNAMGAFTLKPFMPTVLGDGKVAQFSTHSYPSIGFAVMCVGAAVLAVSALMRRNAIHADETRES